MDNSWISFSEIDSGNGFHTFGQSLGSAVVNNTIQIPADRGTGSIKKIDLEKGLHIRSWEFNMSHPISFCRKAEDSVEAGKAFSIVYILSASSITIDSPSFDKEIFLRGSMNILLISNNVDINFHIQNGNIVKAIDITLSAEWMANELDNSDPLFKQFMEKLQSTKHPAVVVERGSSVEYRTAIDLHAHSLAKDKGLLYLKAKTLSLVSDFFSRAFSDHPSPQAENGALMLHHDKLLMVEKLLEDHYEKNLPSIEKIAQGAALSESTLKRHFKQMFGKSIYEYYLEKKMDHAKRLLLEKPLTVKEVAYRLGYEKTSNFIHMFKKFHTYSPGYLKKNISF